MTEPLTVLFEDEHVLAVAKPAGLPTQGAASGGPTLELAVRRFLAPGAPASVYLGTVHRLDRPVSGVVLWAKTPRAARRLAAGFAARTVVKEYCAVADRGVDAAGPIAESGTWDDWLTDSTDASGVVRAAGREAPGSRRAVTRYRVGRADGLPPVGSAVWLGLWPETGRTHQLRAQAALHGLPIRGDLAYGSTRAFPAGIALHALALTFPHPARRRDVTVTAPLPATWTELGLAPPARP